VGFRLRQPPVSWSNCLRMMKPRLVLTLLPSVALLATSALAQLGPLPIDSCDEYVARAMSQVQMATGCNFAGPRWSPDPVEHINWCKNASPRDRGRGERRKTLLSCRGDSGVVPIRNCNEYAARARSQLELAQSLEPGCSFQGMRWSSNLIQHMHWCNRTDAGRHEFEDAARRKELAECKTPR
jgi:hypothetical protein